MSQLAESYTLWLADYYLLSTVLLTVVLLGIGFLKQPSQRLAVTKSSLVALLLLALLVAIPGWSVVHLLTAERSAPTVETPVREQFQQPAVVQTQTPLVEIRSNVVASNPVPAPPPEVITPARPETTKLSWPALFAISHLVGTACIVSWLILGWVASARLRRGARPAPPKVFAILEEVATPDRDRLQQLQLQTHDRIDVAVALGIWRPIILLPEQWTNNQSPENLRTVLAHESTHILNRDVQWVALARALFVALWANPLFWVMRRRLRLDQEALADAAAAELTSRQRYAEQLVAWARDVRSRPAMQLSSAVGLWEGPSQLRQRIAILLNEQFTVLRNCSLGWRLASYGFCVLAALALSLVTIAASPGDTDRPDLPQTTVFQHGIERLGILPQAILKDRPEVKWKYGPTAIGAGVALPSLGEVAAAEEAVYCSDSTGRLFALDANSGQETWAYQTTGTTEAQAPCIQDQTIYYACQVGVVALDRRSGTLLWDYEIPNGGATECSPIVVDNKLFVTGYDGVMRALNANTGEMIWERELLSDAPEVAPARGESRPGLARSRRGLKHPRATARRFINRSSIRCDWLR